MGLSRTIRDKFLSKTGAALMSTTLLLAACDSGGSGMGARGGGGHRPAHTGGTSE